MLRGLFRFKFPVMDSGICYLLLPSRDMAEIALSSDVNLQNNKPTTSSLRQFHFSLHFFKIKYY